MIYSDSGFIDPITDNLLYEGVTYFLDLSNLSNSDRSLLINHPILSNHIRFLPKNLYGELRIDNYVGWLDLLGEKFEVRSKKLLSHLTGNKQVSTLIEDIANVLNSINYKFDSPTSSNSEAEFNTYSSQLEKFDYFRKLIFDLPNTENLTAILNQIFRSPKTSLFSKRTLKPINKVTHTSPKTLKNLFKSDVNYLKVGNSSSLRNSKFFSVLSQKTSKQIFPEKFLSYETLSSLDVSENRFVKHFITEIQNTSFYLRNRNPKDGFLHHETTKVIDWTNNILRNNFFKQVKSLNYIPHSSSTLVFSSGYRQLYDHFIKSRFSFKSILDHLKAKYMSRGLNDIASLYEVWCYFKLCKSILGENLYLTSINQVSKNGEFKFGFEITNLDGLTISYNKTFSSARKTSYSLQFRPDIALELSKNGKIEVICFDAKYKYESHNRTDDIEPISSVKASDIHKMHCYVDAISNCELSLAVYPGNAFVFFNKVKPFKKITEINEINSFTGVGAINLSPDQDEILNSFIEKLLSSKSCPSTALRT
ncbi:MAG: DUF2357 domain-containing protein [Balneola sp.]